MGLGCTRCSRLKQMTEEVLRDLGANGVTLKNMNALDAMAQYGPMLMPALVMGDCLLISGVMPTKERLTRLIRERLLTEETAPAAAGRPPPQTDPVS
jgi:hypothetical protein